MILAEDLVVLLLFCCLIGCGAGSRLHPSNVHVISLFDEVPAAASSTTVAPVPGVDFHGPLWLPRSFKVTCCHGGTPIHDHPELISNWTQSVSDYAIDERGILASEDCRVFEGEFLLAAYALFNLDTYTGYGVRCKCSAESASLDPHCRPLPPCQHGGQRSLALGGRCLCPDQYFGDRCQKKCDQGQKLRGMDGREYCSCVPFYQGDECKDMMCLNGGVEINKKCQCPAPFLGYHCEIDANHTMHSTRFHRFDDNSSSEFFSRDVSSTVFSMIMIVVLIISMYLLMKHRMQVQYQQQAMRSRRDQIGILFNGMPRTDIQPVSQEPLSTMHFVAMGIEGPPPYAPQGRHCYRHDRNLPPLPTYEDATKASAPRHHRHNRATTIHEMTRDEEDDNDNQPTSSTASQPAPATLGQFTNQNADDIEHPLSISSQRFNRLNHERRSI